MRGALYAELLIILLVRIIPADAGSTSPLWSLRYLSADHPRGCGEHLRSGPTLVPIPGSSPRMRGALGGDGVWAECLGIIPADAGSTRYAMTRPGP